MRIALGCDHGALELKNALIPFLRSLGHSVEDFGTYTLESCDYPDYAIAAAHAVADGDCDRGIVLCTTGIGVSIAANKVRGIRCALLSDLNSARMTRLHNDTNMMALGAAIVSQDLAFAIVDAWLSTPFSNEDRHQRRIDKVMSCERGLKKKRRSPKRRRWRSPLISRLLTLVISILLILSMVITPLTTYITSMADPSRLVDILFSSGIFGDTETPTEGPNAGDPEGSNPEGGEPEGGNPEGGEPEGGEPEGGEPEGGEPEGGEPEGGEPEGGEPATAAEVDSDTPADDSETDIPADDEENNTTVDGEENDTTVDGEENDNTVDGEENDTTVDGEENDNTVDGEENDTPVDGEGDDTPVDGEGDDTTSDPSSPQDLLSALQGLFGSDMMDEDTLHTLLKIPTDTSIDTTRLGEKLLESDAAQALVSAYVSDAMESAMGSGKGPSLTHDTVMDIVTPHISQLADIVEECLPEGTTVDRAALEEATLQALEVALPAVVDSLPDLSEAAAALKEQSPELGMVLEVLKFIRAGMLRAAAFLLVVILIVVLCLFRLPGLNGLRCVGISGMISGLLCGGIYLLLTMPTLTGYLANMPSELQAFGTLIIELSASIAHEFAVFAVIYGVIGLFLVLSTTVFRGFFGMIFDAIFSRN